MADWERRERHGLCVYEAGLLTGLPGIVHGFTTRLGGVSEPPYATLNLGAHVEDKAADVQTNRQRIWNAYGFTESRVALAEQVHGSQVAQITTGGPPASGADALITDAPNVLLMLFFADCVPVYLVDPITRAIGLAHAGWRGTVGGIVPRTIMALQEQFGSEPSSCRAVIGPCIGGESYEVGADVASQFSNAVSVTSADALVPCDETTGSYRLDLREIIFGQLLNAGLSVENIAVCQEDTFRNEQDFFSYRRDGKSTGRMAAYLALT